MRRTFITLEVYSRLGHNQVAEMIEKAITSTLRDRAYHGLDRERVKILTTSSINIPNVMTAVEAHQRACARSKRFRERNPEYNRQWRAKKLKEDPEYYKKCHSKYRHHGPYEEDA